MTLSDKQWLFLKDVAKLILKAEELGYKVTGGELYRPLEMQKIYVESGKSFTMKSNHLNRLAIDFNFFIKNDHGRWELTWDIETIKPLGTFWESLNKKNLWGGSWRGKIESGEFTFKDVPHFERQY